MLANGSGLLADAGVVEWPDGTVSARYRFVHDLYREVLDDQLRGPARLAADESRIDVSAAEVGVAARRARQRTAITSYGPRSAPRRQMVRTGDTSRSA
jgi:hypothetical protein